MSKYSFDTTIGEILDSPECMEIVQDMCPELLEHPMKEAARPFPIKVALPFIEGMFTEDQINEFQRRLEAIE